MLAMVGGRAKLALIISLTLISLLATGSVWAQKEVHIIADGQKLTVDTLSDNPQKILANAGISLGPNDEFYLSTKRVENGTVIEVIRAVPVTLTYQGKTVDLFTAKRTLLETVAAAVTPEKNVRIEPGDYFRPSAGLNIKVIELDEKTVEKEVVEPYTIINEPNPHLEKGIERVVEKGTDGLKKLTLRVYLEDGKEIASETVSEEMLVQPKNRVVNVGTRTTIETSRGSLKFKSVRHMEATAYLPTDGDGQCITATGIRARWGIVAVDPRVIPLGTRVYIEGYGVALAADTGGAIKGEKIDLCMEDLNQALRFGRRMIKVYILD